MGIFSRFEDKMEDTVEGAASRMSKAPISPVQIAKKAERQMRRETMVGAGKEYAPTLYTVLVNPDDDARLFGYYPTLAGETETYLKAKASQAGLVMDGSPLVRFIVDENLRHGKFDVVAEAVAAPIIAQLREEEMAHYGLIQNAPAAGGGRRHPAPQPRRQPLPYVPEDQIDRSVDYGEYTFNSREFDDYGEYDRGYDGGYDQDGQNYGAYDGYDESRPMRPGQTIAYAGGAAAAAVPGSRESRVRLVDLNQHRPYDLNGTTITLGRDSSCDIPVSDINASRRHAQLTLNPQGLWVVSDLQSTNGTLVNGVAVASQPLYVGDVITIGKTDFELALA